MGGLCLCLCMRFILGVWLALFDMFWLGNVGSICVDESGK
jgi:hypothetical protein